MSDSKMNRMLSDLADGRTELVFDLLAAGLPANHKDQGGVSLIRHCAPLLWQPLLRGSWAAHSSQARPTAAPRPR